MDSNIGKKLDGRYELLELIGVGGMADIYRARDIEEDRIVAVKILKTEFAGSDEFLRRFRNESKAIALLSHPNIVKIYDVGFTEKVQFIVMEYVDGITLTDYIEQQGLLKWRDAVHFVVQILRALQHAHDRGIVHRDVKSQNVMLLNDGTIKVMDFGIARFNRENNKTMSEKTIGSVHYISPEQARGDITDERSDIYSVGVALYEMLTGKKPFDGDTPVSIALMHMQSTPTKPTDINSTIPEGLEQIVLRAMQKEPNARYQTAGEMIKDLEEFKRNPSIIFEYKYNSTDGSTKYFDRPAVAAASAEKLSRSKKPPVYEEDEDDYDEYDDDYDDDDEDEYEERRSPLIPILFAVGTAFVIATVFLVLSLVSDRLDITQSDYESVLGISGTSSDTVSVNSDDEINMPNLIGYTWEEAVAKYGNLINLQPQQEWSTYTKGEIFEQATVEGRLIKVGDTVVVKVSKGIKQVEVQDFTDRALAAAEQQLKKDGFKVKKIYEVSDDIGKDHVIRSEPAAHEMAAQGSTVVLVVSLGPKETAVYVPKLVDLPLDVALQRCDEYYLTPVVEYVDSEEEKGLVLEQSIDQGEMVDRNTEITLTVSSGEIPEIEKTVRITLPKKAEGEFIFKYYVDGILAHEETRDIGLVASKEIAPTVTGRAGEEKLLTVKVQSTLTALSGTYIEIGVPFEVNEETGQTEAKPYQISINSKIFDELLDGDPVIPGTVGGDDPESSESGESGEAPEDIEGQPAEDTTPEPEVTEPEETEPEQPEESEPEEVPDNNGGIPVA